MTPTFAKMEIRAMIKERCVKYAMAALALETHRCIQHGILISSMIMLHTYVEWHKYHDSRLEI